MNRLECECGRVLGYESRHAGKTVKCSGCGAALKVPAAEKDAPIAMRPLDDPEPEPRPSPKKRKRFDSEDDPRERAPRLEDDDDFYDDEPRRPHREKNDGPLNHLANFLVEQAWLPLVLLIAGGILIPIALYQGALSSAASTTPQNIRLADLADKGPGDNLNVIVSGASPSENFVVERRTSRSRRSGVTSTAESFYIPLLPADAGGPAKAAGFRVLLMVVNSDQSKVQAILSKPEYRGLIVNSITSLDSETQGLLRQTYPATDFSKVYIIEEGREPWSRSLVMTLFLGGILAVALALAMYLVMAIYRTI